VGVSKDKPVCLITGLGDGTGGACARRFHQGGYRIAMLARTQERLDRFETELEGSKGYQCNVMDLDHLTDIAKQVAAEMGAPEVVIHNAAGGSFQSFLGDKPDHLERNFRINTTSLLYNARATAPAMIKAGKGAIIVTGNTSALRGKANYAFFAPTKAAQRILAQSMARELGPKGVHVAYVLIDASIDTPWTRHLRSDDPPEDFFCKPPAIAETIYHVAHQDKSGWTFDVDLRPFGENW